MKRFPCWFTCPIQSHNNISYMSYHRLSWFTLSFVKWWVRLRKGTCHLPIFLLCVFISLLASKRLVWQLPTLGIVINFHQTFPPQLSPKSPLCAYPLPKRVKISSKAPSKNAEFKKDMRVSFLRKKGEKKKKEEVLMILSKSSAKEEFNKITQKYFQSVSPFLPLPWTFVTP